MKAGRGALDTRSIAPHLGSRTLLGLRGVAQPGQSAAFGARRSPVQIRAPRCSVRSGRLVTIMRRRLLALPLAAAIVVAGTGAGAQAATPTLSATVGPGFTISLKKSGRKVTSLRAGSYKIRVSDRSNIHNFHITGPGGLNRRTGVSSTGTTTWTVRLRRGTYRYVCDPHATMMKGSFRVR